MPLLVITSLLLVGLIAANLWWRRASRRQSLPCPTLFAGILEGSLMRWLMGTHTTLDRLRLRPGQHVLELGPGPGRLLIPAAIRVLPGGETTGLDIQPAMIARLEARASRAGISNLTTVVGDAAEPHFDPESFDLIFLCTVLGEIPARGAALQQCHKALKPSGTLSITEIFPDPHFQSKVNVIRLAEAAGFRLSEVQGRWYFFTANFVKNGEPHK
ncbi:MAG: class I SAM-dependent methyltransferase [Anaerolineales bacterium]